MSEIWSDSFYRITVNDPTTVVKKTLVRIVALFVVDPIKSVSSRLFLFVTVK